MDTDIKLDFTKDSKTSSLTFTLGMSYDDVKKSLASVGVNIDKDSYSDYTIIDKKEIWPELKTEEDYYKKASLKIFIVNENMKYTFIFISNNNSNILTSILCYNSNIETNNHIRCGDSLKDLLDIYGNNYLFYNTGKYIIYEYKSNNGYLKFFIDPKTYLISLWGMDLYSFKDGLDENKEYDRIFSSEISNTESPLSLQQNSQNADEYKEDSNDEESSSFEQSGSNETESNSSAITQEEALDIVKNELEPRFREGDYINFDNCQSKEGNNYYVFQYYNKNGTLAWFYVNQSDGSCYVLDVMARENDLIEYHSGDLYW